MRLAKHSVSRGGAYLKRPTAICVPQANQLASLEGIQALRGLRQLHADGNALEALWLPGPGAGERLTSVTLGHNCLASLGAALIGCGELQVLQLSSNRLTALAGLPPCERLQTLDVSHNHLTSLQVRWCYFLAQMPLSTCILHPQPAWSSVRATLRHSAARA
jgi:Leucine-rich repeat (LRR) protein